MTGKDLANLRRKRLYIHKQLNSYEPLVARLRAALAETDAAIQTECPDPNLLPRFHKGRHKRPAFDQMLKDAMRRLFDVLLVWSMDRLGRSVLHVARAMVELNAAGVALMSEQQGIDGTGPFGRAMMQMATVFAEIERSMIRSRVMAGLDQVHEQGGKLGRLSGINYFHASAIFRPSGGDGFITIGNPSRHAQKAATEPSEGCRLDRRISDGSSQRYPIHFSPM